MSYLNQLLNLFKRIGRKINNVRNTNSKNPLAEKLINKDLGENHIFDDKKYLSMAYKVIFEREIDKDGLEKWSNELARGLSRTALVRILTESNEFQLRPLKSSDYWSLVSSKVHHARFKMIKTLLPPANTILDLGGTSTGDARGALLNFGYPYLPEKIYIVDLPPDERMLAACEMSQCVSYQTCDIEYVYTSMADLSYFEEGTFDLIWSGQSIEHISREDAEKVFSQAYKLLKPGGKLALDTPNRAATKLQCPTGYIHPEHKIEYYYKDLCQLLEKYNFKIIDTKGLINLSKTIETSKMEYFFDGIINADYLNNEPEKSYCFYICCMRPTGIAT